MGGACSRRDPGAAVAAAGEVPSGSSTAFLSSAGGGSASSQKPRGAAAVEGFDRKDARPPPASRRGGPVSSKQVSVFRDVFAEEHELQMRREANLRRAQEALQEINPEGKLTKVTSIANKTLIVLDGLVPDGLRGHIFESLQTDAFRRTEFARPDTREFRHHIVEYNVEKLRRTQLFVTIEAAINIFFECPLEVYRIYTNSVMYGDVAFVHRDSCDEEHVTVLVYPNPDWSSELGGETVFYHENGEIADAIEPRAGRICLFHGNILHKGSPPSRLFFGSRYTMAFKFSPVDQDDGTKEEVVHRNQAPAGKYEVIA